MIKNVTIKNFKSIKEKSFDLKNLNILLGLNGMGKSSFIQSILLLKQSKDFLSKGIIQLNGLYTNIGNMNDALYQYSLTDQLLFQIETENDTIELKLGSIKSDDKLKVLNFKDAKKAIKKLKKESFIEGSFQYLNANRLEPMTISKKDYSTVVDGKNVGIHGEYTPHFLHIHGEDKVEFNNLVLEQSEVSYDNKNRRVVDRSLISQINNWMNDISPNVRIKTTEVPNADNMVLGFDYKQPGRGFTQQFKPSNVGFGISYSLSVVTSLLSARSGDFIIIENPESHLHPKGQAALGRLIALASCNNIQIIVETHSDHVINGIRVATKENPELCKRTGIFYFDRKITDEEQFSDIIDIRIDKNGEFDKYPENFMDEWTNQLLKLV